MSKNIQSLWPSDIGVIPERTPLSILREQATALGQMTRNLVQGEVASEAEGGRINHHFDLVTPALGMYRYRLLTVNHAVAKFYPVKVLVRQDLFVGSTSRTDALLPLPCGTEQAYLDLLKRFFGKEKVLQLIRSLIAQSRS